MDQRAGFHELRHVKAVAVLVLLSLSLILTRLTTSGGVFSVHGRRRRGVQMEELQTTSLVKITLRCRAL